MEFMIVDIQCIDYNPICISDAFVDESFNDLEPERGPPTVVLFGRGTEGSIAVRVPWQPWIRIAVPPGKSAGAFVHNFFPGCSYEIKSLKNFYGYEPSSKDPMVCASHEFVQVSLRSFSSASYAQKKKYFFSGTSWDVVDEGSTWAARFCNDFGITECGWLRAPSKKPSTWSTCTYECECLPLQLVVLQRMDVAPIRVMSFDCEMYSHDGLFPNPAKGDETIVTCATIWDYGGESRIVSIVKKPGLIMMEAFRDLIVKEDPDIVTGWNIYGFDFQFLWNEYKKQDNPYQRGLYTTRFFGTPSTFVERTMASAAKGDNTYRYWSMNGRIVVDLMQIIKDDKKPEDNTLKHVANLFLDPDLGKLDVTPHEMFEAWKTQDKDQMQRVVTYCERDSEIPIALIQKLTYVPTWVELARVCFTGLHAILNGGQQRRVYNVIARFVHNKYAINRRDSGWPNDSEDYEGATVIEPKSGYYTTPVSVLDFESLYPSIMIYFNLCPSTMLLASTGSSVPYDEHTIVHDSGPRHYKFAKHVTGVLPELLRHLLRSRKDVKKQMAAATGFDKFVLNGRQNALKIVCNSVYGFCGVSADKGLLPCKPVAAVTTLKGRLFIDSAKNHVEFNWPGSKVLYGDSVTGDTAVVLKINGIVCTSRLDELHGTWYAYHDKEAMDLVNVQVWTDSGFTPIRRVIRHACKKKLFRILTHAGLVDATEDHSLLTVDSEKIRPADVHVGSRLLHCTSYPTAALAPADVISDENEAWAMGLFMADGSADVYDCPSGSKATWAINKADKSLLGLAASKLPFSTQILDTLESSGLYKLVIHGNEYGCIRKVAQRYRDLFYNAAREKKVPSQILCATPEIQLAFWTGFYAGDGDKEFSRVCQRGKESCTGLAMIAERIGFRVSINERSDKPNIFNLTCTRGNQRKDPMAIKRIRELPLENTENVFVYDLETESHHFHVGPGRMVVHNTDSIMVNWPLKADGSAYTIEQAYDLGTLASESVTKLLQSGDLEGLGGGKLDRTSVRLANEKVECPYLLIKKKNYAAVKWTPGKSGFVSELEFKGIDAVRRDRTKVVRDLSEQILDALMVRADASAAKQILQDGLTSVLDNTIPLDDYILSKSLKGSYASENLPHVAAWSRMKSRGDSGLPPQGSRMPYIITMPKKKAPLYEIAEHPDFVKKMALRPWATYYIEQIRSAVERLLEPTGIPVSALFDAAEDQAKFLQNGTASLKPGKRALVDSPTPKKKQKTASASVSLKSFA